MYKLRVHWVDVYLKDRYSCPGMTN